MRIDRIKLITEMAKRDVSVVDLATKTGVSRGTITSIRRGKSCYKLTADAIANALDVDVMELIEEDR